MAHRECLYLDALAARAHSTGITGSADNSIILFAKLFLSVSAALPREKAHEATQSWCNVFYGACTRRLGRRVINAESPLFCRLGGRAGGRRRLNNILQWCFDQAARPPRHTTRSLNGRAGANWYLVTNNGCAPHAGMPTKPKNAGVNFNLNCARILCARKPNVFCSATSARKLSTFRAAQHFYVFVVGVDIICHASSYHIHLNVYKHSTFSSRQNQFYRTMTKFYNTLWCKI